MAKRAAKAKETQETTNNEAALIPSQSEVEASADNQLKNVEKIAGRFEVGFTITDEATAQGVGADLKIIKGALIEIEAKRKEFTRPLDDLKKRFMNLFKPAEERLTNAENIAKGALLAFQQEQTRIAREAAEKARLEQEARLKAERARLEAEALEAEMFGDEDKAAEIEAQQEQIQTVVAAPPPIAAPSKVEGVHTLKVWKCEVADFIALVKHIAASDGQNINLVTINNSELTALARATKGTIAIPGLKFYEQEIIAVRR
jgi:hypothetical protein